MTDRIMAASFYELLMMLAISEQHVIQDVSYRQNLYHSLEK